MAKLIASHNKSMSVEKAETIKDGNYKQKPPSFVLLRLEVIKTIVLTFFIKHNLCFGDPWMTLCNSSRTLQPPLRD